MNTAAAAVGRRRGTSRRRLRTRRALRSSALREWGHTKRLNCGERKHAARTHAHSQPCSGREERGNACTCVQSLFAESSLGTPNVLPKAREASARSPLYTVWPIRSRAAAAASQARRRGRRGRFLQGRRVIRSTRHAVCALAWPTRVLHERRGSA
eukprot:4846538-Prymnesium_polylepis.1